MEERTTEVPSSSNIAPSIHPTTVQQTTTTTTSPSVCTVCGDSAQYSYYGAIVCQSCKVFFRRNAKSQSVPLKCNYDDHCEININNRRICPCCRLAKCFSSGMNAEMIRSSRTKQTKTTEKKKKKTSSTSTAGMRLADRNQPEQIRTLNLLESDQSTLNIDQWNQLSNLVHCFDEYSGLSFIQDFIEEQTALPPKFRFKQSSVNTFFTSMMQKIQLVFEKIRDFLSLSLHDRRTLLRNTIEYTTGIGGAFILQQSQLFDRPAFLKSAELIFRPASVALTKHLIDQLDSDIVFIKIIFAIIAFTISNYTVYTQTTSENIVDTKAILAIQDTYTELVWRYLLYKHNHNQAVLCFSNLIRCLFLLNDSVVEAHEERQFTDIMHSVIQSTEQKLTLNN